MFDTTASTSSIQSRPHGHSAHPLSHGLSVLMWEGASANIFIVLTGGAFLTGLALWLGANDFQIGLLAAAPFLMQSAQLLSPFVFREAKLGVAKVSTTLGASRLLWLIAVPLVFLEGSWRLPALLGIVSVSGLLTMISTPAWLSWMADTVPKRVRGRFFSRRNAAIAAITVSSTITGSLVLDWSRASHDEAYGFAAIILIAVVGGLGAWRAMTRIPSAGESVADEATPRVDLMAPLKDRVFLKVLIVFAAWNVAIGVSAAFFAPHMLTNLKMSFFQIGLYSCAAALVGILSSRTWGRLIDRFGSKTVLNISAFGIAFIPAIWLFPDEFSIWILAPEAVYSGLLWAGFNVAAFTMPIDRSPRQNRTSYLAVFAAVTGLAFFAASVAAGAFAETVSDFRMTVGGRNLVAYHLLFLGSSVLRLLTAGLITRFHEPSETRLPVVIQLMGYAVLKRMSIGRQIFPFVASAESSQDDRMNT